MRIALLTTAIIANTALSTQVSGPCVFGAIFIGIVLGGEFGLACARASERC